jgi:hypothetical protein
MMKRMSAFILCAVLLSSLGLCEAATKSLFAKKITEGENVLSLKGTAHKKMFFMRIFTAGLYLKDGVDSKQAMNDVPKKIEVFYHYPIPGHKLSQYTRDQMRHNLSKKEYAAMTSRIEQMKQYFVDLKPGDRYALSYIPGIGTKFIYNEREVGLIKGADFAKGIFAVWIGDYPMDKILKKQILGYLIDEEEEINHQPELAHKTVGGSL